MNSLKKIVAGVALPLVMAATGLSSVAHAQTIVHRSGFDPISQWIVLDGLFGNTGVFGGNNGVVASGPNGTVVSGNGYGSGPFNDPIAKWIVLDGLFYNNSGIFNGNGY